MDSNNNGRPTTQGGEPPIEAADWRTQLQPDSRQMIVNKIMETLKRHLPFSGQEGLQELEKIAVSFEEKVYTAAISQSDYLRKISLKMLTMENKSNPMPNPMQSNSAVNNMNSPDPELEIGRPTQGGEPPIEAADWRTHLQPDSRQRIVNKIMETLKRHHPFSGQEGLQELEKIAVSFEEKVYTAAISQSDYLRKISLKMLTMENKSNPMPNPMQSNSAVNSFLTSPDVDDGEH